MLYAHIIISIASATEDLLLQQVGPWVVNDVSSPEVEELIEAFKAMSTVVKAANMNLRSGNFSVARDNYVNALILFKKLEDDRGVRVLRNRVWRPPSPVLPWYTTLRLPLLFQAWHVVHHASRSIMQNTFQKNHCLRPIMALASFPVSHKSDLGV